MTTRFAVVAFALPLLAVLPAGGAWPKTGRSVTMARHGMVAASQPLAAQIGLDVLKAGGNAIDAAIATNAALGLMEPTSCGPGGDLFAIVWDAKSKKLYGLNASGRSPHRRGRPRRLLPRPDRRGTGPPLRQGRRPVHDEGLRRPHFDLGRAGVFELSRLRRLGVAAELPGDRHAADAQHPRRLRLEK